MKIDLKLVRIPPKNIDAECCIFNVTPEIENWIERHNLDFDIHPKGYYNIRLPEDRNIWLGKLFNIHSEDFERRVLDGFSPNLNKELHVGHLSNIIYASAIKSLTGIETIAILNDTDNHKDKDTFEENFNSLTSLFNYGTSRVFYASEMYYRSSETYISSDTKYTGCRVINLPKSGLKVLTKSTGESTYLHQDLALAQHIQDTYGSLIYLTGSEQISHFDTVKELFPENKHMPIGLVTLDRVKVSSRKGNVILISDLLKKYSVNTLKDSFLRYNISSSKNNLKLETGLSSVFDKDFNNKMSNHGWFDMDNPKLVMAFLISYNTMNPSFFYNSLIGESVKDINIGLRILGYKLP